jgi:FkbM family methyltransferase
MREIYEKCNVVIPAYDEEWIVFDLQNMKKVSYVPNPIESHHGTEKHERELKSIYMNEGFVEMQKGDVVVDVGAHVGTFSKAVSEKADRVIAIDPNASLNNCLQKNVSKKSNIEVVKKGLWKEKCNMEMSLSVSANDNSLLGVDDETLDTGNKVRVELDTLENIAEEKSLEVIDFLKVEAEGAEPEVLMGALCDELEVKKICVNCGPERKGQEPTSEVSKILTEFGYDVRRTRTSIWDASIVFARKDIQ